MTEEKKELTTKPIDCVVKAYSSKRRPIEVPKWKLTLWFGPLTESDMQAIEEREPKDRYERNVMLLIHKAELEDGSQAFAWGDLYTLMHKADYVIMQTLIAHMYGSALDLDELREEAEKKSEKTAGSDSD